ncbi:MAG: type II secretion system F family protein [Candidatus Paceibacterota bacterium]|jgi:type IV pilus assembly protein PilC
MQFKYKVIEQGGQVKEGTIDAGNVDLAIASLQRRGLVLSSIKAAEEAPSGLDKFFGHFFHHVSNKEIVILSQQISILFEAQVSALRVFTLLASETPNPIIRSALQQIADDLQGGDAISKALSKHPNIFDPFYISMVKSGEESGKLDVTFLSLSEYLDRVYEVTSKARNALIYPAFVIMTFVTVMFLMFSFVIPRISVILKDNGGDIPVYTKIIIAFSDFLAHYGIFFVAAVIVCAFFAIRYARTSIGKESVDQLKLAVPYVGDLYRKLYLARIADSMQTMLLSGVSMMKALEVTRDVVGNKTYEDVLNQAIEDVKGGSSVSIALSNKKEIPNVMVQMIKVGEEVGGLGNILKTLSRFYNREVVTAVDTLVGLIEPAMIIALGLGVGFLLVSVLMPIYNIASTFGE